MYSLIRKTSYVITTPPGRPGVLYTSSQAGASVLHHGPKLLLRESHDVDVNDCVFLCVCSYIVGE